jgi:hypothetical protein
VRIVIPSVDYADMLAATLPAWRQTFPTAAFVVVTAKRDRATIATAHAAGAAVLETEAWTAGGHRFNKARALDEAFDFASRPAGEICIAIDADVYPFGALHPLAITSDTTLYCCDRFYCESPAILQRQIARPDRAALARMTAGRRGAGYFQAFRARPTLTYGSYPTAGYYDLEFHRHFAGIAVIDSLYVLHLGRKSGKNWTGRILPRWGAA